MTKKITIKDLGAPSMVKTLKLFFIMEGKYESLQEEENIILWEKNSFHIHGQYTGQKEGEACKGCGSNQLSYLAFFHITHGGMVDVIDQKDLSIFSIPPTHCKIMSKGKTER